MRLFLTLAILAVAAGRGAFTCDLMRPGVDCNDEELLHECGLREGQCFSVISSMFTTPFEPFIYTPERLDQFCSAVQSVISCDESLPEVCQNKTSLIDTFEDYHDYICAAENRNGVISAGKCINDSNVLNGIIRCQTPNPNPSPECSSIKESLKCSAESVHGACGQEVSGVFANILQGYASYGMSHFLTDCDALDVLNAYKNRASSERSVLAVMTSIIMTAFVVIFTV